MPVPRRSTAYLSALLGLCASAWGDTVILKSGEKLEGKILSETDAEVTMSVQVSATIKDERVVKREDIAKVETVQPDALAWAAIASLVPGSESLERDEYDRVRMALSYFTSTFPKSPHAPLAQQRLDQYTAEEVRVTVGEVKLNGQWLAKERALEERVQIGGRVILNRMKRAAAAGQLTEAMANFDLLEKSYAGALSMPEAVELARRILPPLTVAIEQRRAAAKRQMDDEKARLAGSKGAEHTQLETLLKQEHTRTDAQIAASERAGLKWLPLQPANEKSLAALTTRVNSETTRISNLKLEKMQDSAKLAQDGATALSVGNFDAAERLLKEAATAWPENELAKRMQAKLADAKKGATSPKPPAPAPTPAPASRKTSSSSSAVPAAANSAPGDPTPAAPSLFKRPAFLIGVAAAIAFGAVAAKKIAKSRAPSNDLLDQ